MTVIGVNAPSIEEGAIGAGKVDEIGGESFNPNYGMPTRDTLFRTTTVCHVKHMLALSGLQPTPNNNLSPTSNRELNFLAGELNRNSLKPVRRLSPGILD